MPQRQNSTTLINNDGDETLLPKKNEQQQQQQQQTSSHHRQEPLDGSGISNADLIEYQDASKKDLSKHQLLAFDGALYDKIVKLESIPIPCSGDGDEETYFSQGTSLVIVMLIFALPFIWSIVSPLLKLNPPDYVFFDGCQLKNSSSDDDDSHHAQRLNFSDCVICNGGNSNALSTKGINIFESFQWTYVGFLWGLTGAFIQMIFYYKLLVKRSHRNEILLCYGIFLRPVPFKLWSSAGAIVIVTTLITLAGACYVDQLSTEIEKAVRGQIRFGETFDTPVCLAGTYANRTIFPVFKDTNPSFDASELINPFTILSIFLPFVPVIITIYNLVVSPIKNISSLNILQDFESYKKTVKVEVNEPCFDKAIGEFFLATAQKKNSQKEIALATGKGFFKAMGRWILKNNFATTWGTTLEDISDVCERALKIQDFEEAKTKIIGGDDEQQQVLDRGGNPITDYPTTTSEI